MNEGPLTMAMSKEKKQSDNGKTEALEPGPAKRPTPVDPWDRWGPSEFPWRPSWFGLRLPDRILGEVGGLFDHIKIEEYLDDGTLVVRAELPGVDPDEDIEISAERDRLTIRAERTSHTEDDTDGYRSEFRYGAFSRVVGLPEGADVEQIDANYVDGILEVRIPMPDVESSPVKKVKIGRG